MGARNTTRRNSEESSQQNQEGGLYFGSHFFLGNRQNNQEEGWLFGGLGRDLSLLSAIGNERSTEVHQTVTVSCPVNLIKNTLQLVPIPLPPIAENEEISSEDGKEEQAEGKTKKYQIQFQLNTLCHCSATVYCSATEIAQEEGAPMFNYEQKFNPMYFERGLNQTYIEPVLESLDTSKYDDGNENLIYDAEKNFYPVVIVLEADDSNYFKANREHVAFSQITYAALIHCSDDSYAIKPIKQKIRYDGKNYLVYDMFGVETIDQDGGRECVICMTDPRDTVVLPCRHLCLCEPCAEMLLDQSNKCPICRSTVKSMVQLEIQRKNGHNTNNPKLSKNTNNNETTDSFSESSESEEELTKTEAQLVRLYMIFEIRRSPVFLACPFSVFY